MKTIPALVVLSLLTIRTAACAQSSPTNSIGQAEVVRIVAQFRVGMPERELTRVLEKQHGLRLSGGAGDSFGWSRGYVLSDGCRLAFQMKPKEFNGGGAWGWVSGSNGLLVSACIESNGVKIPITLSNALQLSGPANGSQPVRAETNSTPAAAGSRR